MPIDRDGYLLEEQGEVELKVNKHSKPDQSSNHKLKSVVNTKLSMNDCWSKVELCNYVMQHSYLNAWGARIPVESGWNLKLLDSLLVDYQDREVVGWLRYSWPVSRPPNWLDPVPSYGNHASATEFQAQVDNYIDKELNRKATCQPFKEVPFSSRIGVSPLSSRDKKESAERRIIMDLSWPIGQSVNLGIAKDQFMGLRVKLTFPTIDVIARRVTELRGSGDIYLFKVDLLGYFRQLPIDPGDYSLLCFMWKDQIFFDIMSPMGFRSAPFFAQRTSDVIRYIHNRASYFIFNYIDDFMGVEVAENIHSSFNALVRLLRDLGVKEVVNKRVDA